MEYPLISEYRDAILSAEDNFKELSSLRPVLDGSGNPVMSSGNFAVVFKMIDENDGKLYAVKCFIKEQEGRNDSYRKIADELDSISSPYIVSLRFLEDELFVDSAQCECDEFPVVLMDWVEGESLDAYLQRNLSDKFELDMLSYRFNMMAAWLLSQPFAHGDLKPDNILVRADGSLVLVDYDGMFVPAMKGEKAREIGSPNYRHPLRTDDDFDEHIDDFPVATIALSLKAIALNPKIIMGNNVFDSLLLSKKDFQNPSCSDVLIQIQSLSDDITLLALLGAYYIVLSKGTLDTLSCRLFITERPIIPKLLTVQSDNIEMMRTDVRAEDWVDAIEDEYGVFYSQDGKYLLSISREYFNNQAEYKIRNGTEIICDEAFSYCINLTNITIPDTVIAIGNEAFEACRRLHNIKLPDSVKIIGNGAFQECISLKNMIIPSSVMKMGDNPFEECINLELKLPKNSNYLVLDGLLLEHSGRLISCLNHKKEIVLPKEVRSIGNAAFSWCEKLVNVIFSDYILSIGDRAFQGCSLKNIILPDSLTTIGNGAFSGCPDLKEMLIPDSVIHLGANPFYGCSKLSLKLSDNSNFRYADGLLIDNKGRLVSYLNDRANIIIPNSVKSIGRRAFVLCQFLRQVKIPYSVISIEDRAFEGCTEGLNIIIPRSLRDIGYKAFPQNCKIIRY